MTDVKLIGERITLEQWRERGSRRFSDDYMKWKFVCPSCGAIISVQDYKDCGAPESAVGYSCIGRFKPNCKEAFQPGKQPCNYAGGGLIKLNPIFVQIGSEEVRVFDFAPACEPEVLK